MVRCTLALLLVAAGCGKDANQTLAKRVVTEYATIAYPTWARDHPAERCPDDLADIAAFTGNPGLPIKDPWGTEYRMYCGEIMPVRLPGIAVLSFGPDRTENTADDIRSWEP
jgi:hypothetical protein